MLDGGADWDEASYYKGILVGFIGYVIKKYLLQRVL